MIVGVELRNGDLLSRAHRNAQPSSDRDRTEGDPSSQKRLFSPRIVSPNQKKNFTANCPMRGASAEVTGPKAPLLILPFGVLHWAWLKILNHSVPNSKPFDSVWRTPS